MTESKAKKPKNYGWEILNDGTMAEKVVNLTGFPTTGRLFGVNEEDLLEKIKDFEERHGE